METQLGPIRKKNLLTFLNNETGGFNFALRITHFYYKPSTLTFLINGETLINREDGKFMLSGRVENIFYYIKIHVEGGKFLKIK